MVSYTSQICWPFHAPCSTSYSLSTSRLGEQLTLNQWAQGSSPWKCTTSLRTAYRSQRFFILNRFSLILSQLLFPAKLYCVNFCVGPRLRRVPTCGCSFWLALRTRTGHSCGCRDWAYATGEHLFVLPLFMGASAVAFFLCCYFSLGIFPCTSPFGSASSVAWMLGSGLQGFSG